MAARFLFFVVFALALSNITCQIQNGVNRFGNGYSNGCGCQNYGGCGCGSQNYGGCGCGAVNYGDVSINGELPVTGCTTVGGQVPVIGYVNFEGYLPANGLVSVSPNCGCGCGKC